MVKLDISIQVSILVERNEAETDDLGNIERVVSIALS